MNRADYNRGWKDAMAAVEYFAAGAVLVWGVWVLAWGPGAALSSAAFETLRANAGAFGPPWRVVGLGGVIVGAIYGMAIYINGRGRYWTPFVRGLASISVVIFLGNLSISIGQQQGSNTGVVTYALAAAGYFGLFLTNLDRFAQAILLLWERVRGVGT